MTDFKPQEVASMDLANALYDKLQARFGHPCTNFRDVETDRTQGVQRQQKSKALNFGSQKLLAAVPQFQSHHRAISELGGS